MSTARRRLKSPRSLSGTSAHPSPYGHTSHYHGHEWMTHISSFHVNRPSHSWDKAISDSVLETSRSRTWVWSKGKVIQYPSFSFHTNQINNSWDTAISKFDLETSKVKVMSEVKGQGHMSYPVSNWCTSFSFHINRTNHSWDMTKIVFWPWNNTLKEICQNNSFWQNFS